MTMLPPIWVNAWLSQSSRNGRLRKTAIVPVSSGSSGPAGSRTSGAAPASGRSVIAASARPPLHEQMPAAGLAAQADVGAEAVDEPRGAATRMAAAQAQDVAEVQLDGS